MIGRVGTISCSLPAAIRLPVNVRYPRITSTPIAPIRNVVSSPSCSHRMYFAVPTSAGGQAAEGVRQRRPLRHRGQRHLRERNADRRADDEGDDDPRVVDDLRVQQRADDRRRHAGRRRQRRRGARSSDRSASAATG